MSIVSPSIRNLARRLIVLEAAREDSPVTNSGDAMRVYDRLRLPLSKLAGIAGFRSLMSRALVMAKAELPSLVSISVLEDGSLKKLDCPEQDRMDDGKGEIVVLAHLLGLLVTFIGEPLTLQLVRDAWPSASMIGIDFASDEGL